MRVNPNPMPDLLAATSETQQQINTDLEQLASGRSINRPSDNPVGAAMLVRNAAKTGETDQFLRSASGLSGEMQNADSALSSVITILQRAISLGVEGANGTANSSERASLAAEIQGIQSELINLANLSYQGNFVFAGTATQTAPYVSDSTSASGVRYVGNAEVNSVTVGDHLTVKANLPGSDLFTSPGSDVFQALQDLVTNLQSGSNIDGAVNEVNAAYQHISTQRVFFGNAINQLDAQQTFLNSQSTQLAAQENTICGADLPKVISELVNAETSREATLSAVSKTQQANLFDYIK